MTNPIVTPAGHYLGRLPPSPDPRDMRFKMAHPVAVEAVLPPSVDLRPQLPPVYDQGALGSCTAQAGAGMMATLIPGFDTSRLGLYYDTRLWEGDTANDTGAETRDVLKVLMRYGVIAETQWPYDIAKFTDPPRPWAIVHEAATRRITSYSRLVTERECMACLAAGFPFLTGVLLYSSFESKRMALSGIMIPPTRREQIIGGHAMLVVGYDTDFKASTLFLSSKIDPALVADLMFLVRNSWSDDWGIKGYCWMPAAYILNPSIGNDCFTGRMA